MKSTMMNHSIKTKSLSKALLLSLFALFILAGCSKDDDGGSPTAELNLDIIGLEQLGSEAEYQAWIVVDGENRSLGRFTDVNFPKTFTVNADMLNDATQFKLSIEPGNDPSPEISNTVLLSGMFSGNAASLDISQTLGDFFNASGQYVLQTPTDNVSTNEESGIYWYDPANNSAGLQLPTLPEGWRYEGWVVIPTNQGDVNLSTGTFRSPLGRDEFAPYSASVNTPPPFPGEDFLNLNQLALNGVNVRPDLRGKMVFISIEPSPDNDSSEPFLLQPLRGRAGSELSPSLNTMDLNRASFPLGTANRE